MSKTSGVGYRVEDGQTVMVNPAVTPHPETPERRLAMARRQALLIELHAIEDYLGMAHSRETREERRERRDAGYRQGGT